MALSNTKLADFVARGGLAQVHSREGLPRLGFAFDHLLKSNEEFFFLWVSDEGYLFPETLSHRYAFPLQQLVIAKVPTPADAWKVALEGVQAGLFGWIFLRSSRGCPPAFLRKLQLASSRAQARVLIFCPEKLPHWLLKTTLEIDRVALSVPTGKALRG